MAEKLDTVAELSFQLYRARKEAEEQEPLTLSHKELDLPMAYEIQGHGIELRRKDGEKIIGYKMGLTSKAKMEQMGLHQPIFGVLTDKMQVSQKGEFSLAGKIHPKAEPEIFFVTHK
ncbi:MAG: 2-oxopent-4-enoate hydratase, partial [Bdellovibrionales bacterium]|nr:2-oxopent-4-enoate hydratase [Bdellovibrionales bacterium]